MERGGQRKTNLGKMPLPRGQIRSTIIRGTCKGHCHDVFKLVKRRKIYREKKQNQRKTCSKNDADAIWGKVAAGRGEPSAD